MVTKISIINKVVLLVLLLTASQVLQAQKLAVGDTIDRYLSLIDSSFTASSQNDYALAERYLSQAMQVKEHHPLNIYLLNNLGALQQIQGKFDEAEMSYGVALLKNPDEQTIRFNRAKLYALIGKHKAAITDYSILVSQAPKNELYLYHRAMSYLLVKNYDLADLDLSEILKLSPNSLKARIGLALLETMRGNYDKAERIYDYLVEQLPKSSEVYEGRARMYLARQMKGFALRDMNKAFELAKLNVSPSLYRLRGELMQAIGEGARAKEDLEAALKLELNLDPTKQNNKE